MMLISNLTRANTDVTVKADSAKITQTQQTVQQMEFTSLLEKSQSDTLTHLDQNQVLNNESEPDLSPCLPVTIQYSGSEPKINDCPDTSCFSGVTLISPKDNSGKSAQDNKREYSNKRVNNHPLELLPIENTQVFPEALINNNHLKGITPINNRRKSPEKGINNLQYGHIPVELARDHELVVDVKRRTTNLRLSPSIKNEDPGLLQRDRNSVESREATALPEKNSQKRLSGTDIAPCWPSNVNENSTNPIVREDFLTITPGERLLARISPKFDGHELNQLMHRLAADIYLEAGRPERPPLLRLTLPLLGELNIRLAHISGELRVEILCSSQGQQLLNQGRNELIERLQRLYPGEQVNLNFFTRGDSEQGSRQRRSIYEEWNPD